jgi:hypothetical protein
MEAQIAFPPAFKKQVSYVVQRGMSCLTERERQFRLATVQEAPVQTRQVHKVHMLLKLACSLVAVSLLNVKIENSPIRRGALNRARALIEILPQFHLHQIITQRRPMP